MQPYIYMSIGVRADGLNHKDIEQLEKVTNDSYFYCEDFAEDEQIFVFDVLYSPWESDEYSASKTISVKEINRLYEENKGNIVKYQNVLKEAGMNDLVDRVDVIVHVTEL